MCTEKSCVECGGAFNAVSRKTAAGVNKSRFCGTPCRKKFNNRRMVRGAILYDLSMTMRKDRKDGSFGDLCHQISLFLAADREAGRQTHNTYGKSIPYQIPKSTLKG